MKIIKKPWGREIILFKRGKIILKILNIRKGEETSLQMHRNKNEAFLFLDDNATLKTKCLLDVGVLTRWISKEHLEIINKGLIHRLKARQNTKILELAFGNNNDIIRLEDKYNRTGGKEKCKN